MTWSVYFGRPLYSQAEPYRVEFAGNTAPQREQKSWGFPLRFDHKLFVKLNYHNTAGVLIDTASIYRLQGLKKEIVAAFELQEVTVDTVRPDQISDQMYVVLSFERMTKKLF